MEEPIGDLYFNWLCAKVRLDNRANYIELLRIMHLHEFVAIVSGDENRVADVYTLREHFLAITDLEPDQDFLDERCSVLEVLISFSERADFQINITARSWFWQFITNLRLEDYRRATLADRGNIDHILERFVMRRYGPNGDGGLFPLRRPQKDQRKVEIFYQFCEYVEENGLLYELL